MESSIASSHDIFDPNSVLPDESTINTSEANEKNVVQRIIKRNVLLLSYVHVAAIIGLSMCNKAKYQTLIFAFVLYLCGMLGITAGAHRLWSHRSYKAKLPLRILLCLFQTIAVQKSIYDWARDHRVHHKFTETDADPHNAKRGFFFCHIGWLFVQKHPDVIEKGSSLNIKDLLDDPVVKWQRKFYAPLAIFLTWVLPTIIPYLCWNESLMIGYLIPGVLRLVINLHAVWLVNSVAHMIGHKPYDKRINPVENFYLNLLVIGEGSHNFHHTFPVDYATSEYGFRYFNLSKSFIDFMALIGQAYDLKITSKESIFSRRKKTGDLAGSSQHLE